MGGEPQGAYTPSEPPAAPNPGLRALDLQA
jgi:hypothetical protein